MQALQNMKSNRFGDYYLTAHLGRGGMADVYRARHIGAAGFQRTVVVKRILSRYNGDSEFVQMFINEAKLASGLAHPNIAQIYELGQIDGEFFIAMEYVKGRDLRELLTALARNKTTVPPQVAAFIAREVCRGLAHAHAHVDEQGAPAPIIHRDVSLANIVIAYDGQVKLVDFGIAKALYANSSSDTTHTQAGILKGKLGYMAPEQADGFAIPQSDVFATGVVLYEMLTVRRLFKGDNPIDTLARLKTMPIPLPSQYAEGVPTSLDAIVAKALERDLDMRYVNAGSMAKDLDLFLQAQQFSIEDVMRYMNEQFPPESHTDPSMSSLSGALQLPVSRPSIQTMSSRFLIPDFDEQGRYQLKQPFFTARRLFAVGALALVVLVALSVLSFRRYQVAGSHPAAGQPTLPAGMAARVVAPPEEPPLVRGVTDNEIMFGMAAALSGPGKEYGRAMKAGIEAAFKAVNDSGGVHGRQLHLTAVDDGYEPARTIEAMKDLFNKNKVFAFVGNTGTPTAAVAVPFALERRSIFFGAFSGAGVLRRDPPDRYVFNFRASYGEETVAVVKYLIKVRHIRPENIAVFAQEDPFGDAGFAGVQRAMRVLRPEVKSIFRVGYKRNTIDVNDAVTRLRERPVPVRAVIMLALYRPAAKFIERVRDLYPNMMFASGSYVDSSALAEELKMLGPKYADGVVVTQVVPAPESNSTAVLEYKTALQRYQPGDKPDCVSLEGYLMANVLIEALRRTGPRVDTEQLVKTIESIHDYDLGIGAPINFGSVEHQGSHKVWGIQLDMNGAYQPIDLE
jgi:serine/threonine protein kinase/ABC-type branched-subunit amino acid transport system substrate-binding protein